MDKTLKVGLTGGIGSGKSLVAKIFKELGIPCYDSDIQARWVTENSPEVKDSIQATFGNSAYLTTGEYNRKLMAEMIFKNPASLEKLNSIVHPALEIDFNLWCQHNSQHAYILKEAALLFETGINKKLDKMIVVSAPINVRIQRIISRDPQRSKEQIEDIIKNQWPEEEKLKLADFIVNNDDKHLIIPQVLEIHKYLIESKSNGLK